jgi:hypothetical protein
VIASLLLVAVSIPQPTRVGTFQSCSNTPS